MADNDTLSRATYCRSQADLFSDGARVLIYRYCKPWLEQRQVSVCELLHSSHLQNHFMSAGAYLSNTVQKVAIVQVETSKVPIQTRVKELYTMCDELMLTVREDLFAGKTPPPFDPKNFKGYVAAVRAIDMSPFNQEVAIRKTIASYLATITHMELKMKALIDLLDDTPGNDTNIYTDMFIADVFMSGQAIKEFLGEAAGSLYARLVELIDIYKGRYNREDNPYATRLAKILTTTKMPITIATISEHIANTLEQNNTLVSTALKEEVKAITDLFGHLKIDNGYIGGPDIEQIMSTRAGWIVNAESLTILIKDFTEREEKLKALMDIYPLTLGSKNKRTIMTFVERIVEEWADRADARGGAEPTVDTLKTIGWIARAIGENEMPDSKREKLNQQIHKIYDAVSKKLNILAPLEKSEMPVVEKALHLLDLIKHNAFMGKDLPRARAMAKNFIRDPAFLESYVNANGTASETEQKKRLVELLQLFQQSGI